MRSIETNESTTLFITVTFKDEDEVLIVPVTADYRIHDITTKNLITDWTVITPLASSVDVVISALENVMISSKRTYEDRMLTVRFTYSGNRSGLAQQVFRVNNINFAP